MTMLPEVQALAGDTLIELFEVDATSIGGQLYRFHAGTNPVKGAVVWQGHAYSPMPIEASGFEITGTGKSPRPTIRVQNVDGLMGAVAEAYQDLIGALVRRKRALLRHLDAVNFPNATNPTADPTAAYPDDVYAIFRKVMQTKTMIEFELALPIDVHRVRIPLRPIVQHVCTWEKYRGPECGYTGGPVATANDVPTTNVALDQCGRRVSSCKLRFGALAELPFGGFPGVGLVRQ